MTEQPFMDCDISRRLETVDVKPKACDSRARLDPLHRYQVVGELVLRIARRLKRARSGLADEMAGSREQIAAIGDT